MGKSGNNVPGGDQDRVSETSAHRHDRSSAPGLFQTCARWGCLLAGQERNLARLQRGGLAEQGGQCAGDGGGVAAVLREGLG
jgi:hypothetical protein